MPRDANGNYTLPAGNPVVSGTTVTSTWANDTMSDLGNEMQDSLSRSGKGGFSAPVGFVDKSGSTPGLNFISEPTSGLKREATEDVRIQITATDVLQATKTGVKALSGGSLKDVAVEESGQKIMRGAGGTTRMLFYNATPPTGWALHTPDGNLRALIVHPSAGGTLAGLVDPVNLPITGSVNGHSLSIAEMPSHNHPGSVASFSYASNQPGANLRYDVSAANTSFQNGVAVASQGSGATHTHGVNLTVYPRYATVILATLNA